MSLRASWRTDIELAEQQKAREQNAMTTAVPRICACGCGRETHITRTDNYRAGTRKGDYAVRLHGHATRVMPRGADHWHWQGDALNPKTYRRLDVDGTRAHEHRRVVERALGHALPLKSPVHHVNRVRRDNQPGNLVACEDDAYHKLLHRRQLALDTCGHAGWLKCRFCKRYDDPANMRVVNEKQRGDSAFHLPCSRAYRVARAAGINAWRRARRQGAR